MKKIISVFLVLAGLFNIMPSVSAAKSERNPSASFAAFDQRANAGERLNIVFFGASLTWGANASNPPETSYRADVARRFEVAYPKAHFRFFDAAIGGTGSQLGVFRLERDVLRHNPDLVFLDFSANDDIYSADPVSLASYESIVRRLVLKKLPTVQVIFPFQWNIKPGEMAKMKRRDAHREISRRYKTGLGDAIELISQRVESGKAQIKTLWPLDGVHPGDKGYALFGEAAWQGYVAAVAQNKTCSAPKAMLYAPTYMEFTRMRISQIGPLASGWKTGIPNRTSAYFDFLMSRWLDDEVIAAPGAERLQARFRGENVMLFGEATLKSGAYRVYIDGKLVEHSPWGSKEVLRQYSPGEFAKKIGGNGHHAQTIASGLATGVEHTLEIEPVLDTGQELRLESICVAGHNAKVWRAD